MRAGDRRCAPGAQFHAPRSTPIAATSPADLLTASIPFPIGLSVERKEQTLDAHSRAPAATTGHHARGRSAAGCRSRRPAASRCSPFHRRSASGADRRCGNVSARRHARLFRRAGHAPARRPGPRRRRHRDVATAPLSSIGLVRRQVSRERADREGDRRVARDGRRSHPTGKVEAFIVGVVDDLKQDRPGDPAQAEILRARLHSWRASTHGGASLRRRAHDRRSVALHRGAAHGDSRRGSGHRAGCGDDDGSAGRASRCRVRGCMRCCFSGLRSSRS